MQKNERKGERGRGDREREREKEKCQVIHEAKLRDDSVWGGIF